MLVFFVVTMFHFLSYVTVWSVCSMESISILRNDLFTSCSSLFCRATNFERYSNICPGLAFWLRDLLLALSCFNQLVVLFGVTGLFVFCCFFWLCAAVLLTFAGLQLEILLSGLLFLVLARWNVSPRCSLFAVFSCLASSKQNFLIFSWFLLYSPTVLQATYCIACNMN